MVPLQVVPLEMPWRDRSLLPVLIRSCPSYLDPGRAYLGFGGRHQTNIGRYVAMLANYTLRHATVRIPIDHGHFTA